MREQRTFLNLITTIAFSLIFILSQAQNSLKSFQWRDHLAYNKAVSVTELDNKVYCIVTSINPENYSSFKQTHQGLFIYDKTDNSYAKLSKVEGLSDINPILVKANEYNKTVLIAYSNSNIDLIKNKVIINISDLLRKSIPGNKNINSIYFKNQYAYLSTGFGIVVINTDTYEVKDTYIIGSNGTNITVYETSCDNTNLYAATEKGLYTASLNSPNLANYQNWSLVPDLPIGPYNICINLNGSIFVNYSKYLTDNTQVNGDTIYFYGNNQWNKFPNKNYNDGKYRIRKIIASEINTAFAIIDNGSFECWDLSGALYFQIWGYQQNQYPSFQDAIFDKKEPGVFWMADRSWGLIKFKADWTSPFSQNNEWMIPNGPNSNLVSELKIVDNTLFVAPVNLGESLESSYIKSGVNRLKNGEWKEIPNNSYFDLNTIAIDSANPNHFYTGSWGNGVVEYLDDAIVNVYNETNSSLHGADGSSPSDLRVNSVCLDKDKNLWVGQAYTTYLLSVKKTDGTWKDLNFSAFYSNAPKSRKTFIDRNNQVWIILVSSGMLVYKNDGTFSQPNFSNTKKILKAVGSGNLPSVDVNCLAEDKEGDIWVGTNGGVGVFYNPESILSQQSGWDAQQIMIQQDGHTHILLETENINCITVDGANNKWIGTSKSGVFCLSPDGQKEIYHFTTENSPLFANNIISIAINNKTGEVFIATEKGIISFQSTTIDGFDTFQNVYSYPNPVKPDYNGPILIKGMINGAIVKITDVSGNLVYETKAEGGQAIWYAKNFKNERVASGVYFAMCATANGEEKTITKILVIN